MSHSTCEKLLQDCETDRIGNSIQTAHSKFVERHKDNIEVTAKVFRTAYECAKSHLPYTENCRLIDLQTLNGINCGNILYSNNSCSNIINHVASEMRKELVNHIIGSKLKFSILVHDSTSVSNVQSMIVYICTRFDGETCTYIF